MQCIFYTTQGYSRSYLRMRGEGRLAVVDDGGRGKRSVRTMVFTPDFSLLFGLTHFTFVNFSYPYNTNLFSYLPFILSYTFTLTDHTMKKE